MKLLRYRVRNFRSVNDSGWIDCDDVTTLVGVNEAGKSNLLLALWKLNPAKGGQINLLADLPRSRYSDLRGETKGLKFIETEFELSDGMVEEIVLITGGTSENVRIASVSKDFSGTLYIGFPNGEIPSSLPSKTIIDISSELKSKIESLADSEDIRRDGLQYLQKMKCLSDGKSKLTSEEIHILIELLQKTPEAFNLDEIKPFYDKFQTELSRLKGLFVHPSAIKEVRSVVLRELPSFVYYSNYGNLDSEIYLPHVIENLKRTDLTGTAEAKARTLRVLFEFVNLDPQEILELGADPEPIRNPQNPQHIIQQPSEHEIEAAGNRKIQREVLLQSAATSLTKQFRNWWKQGEHIFDFRADGKHFRILVSDDLRPEKVELESRSTGLQWFFSFFLVFLVESKESHKGSILLLDEAGLSLHPLAQKDLGKFFENLSSTNQIINTTHSPFLVDTNHVDRVKVVYVDESGHTVASSNLRAGLQKPQEGSIYAIHAALGLSISDALLQGCRPVIVEGPSDQFYLSAIKNYLISKSMFTPKEELVFIPSGGVKGVESISAILSGKDEHLPFVLLDSDKSGKDFKNKLLTRLYKDIPNRVLEVADFYDLEGAEIEDLIPFGLFTNALNKMFRHIDDELFADIYEEEKALVPQIEQFARHHSVLLEPGWKVELSKQVKNGLQSGLQRGRIKSLPDEYVDRWRELFERFIAD